jgi:hypothetical protein
MGPRHSLASDPDGSEWAHAIPQEILLTVRAVSTTIIIVNCDVFLPVFTTARAKNFTDFL